METLGDKKKQLSSNKYCCEICDYNTCRKSNIDKHFLSDKHKNMAVGDNGDKKKQISSKKKQESAYDHSYSSFSWHTRI